MPKTTSSVTAPIAARRAHSFTRHGVTIEDPYHWLRDPGYPKVEDADVLAYLEAENNYFEATMASQQQLTQTLFEEIKARQKSDDTSVPVKDGDYFYQWRYAEGAQYRTWLRWPVADPRALTVLVHEPALAEGNDYFALGSFSVSHDGNYLAYSADTNGSERYILRVKDLRDGRLLEETIENTRGDAVWASDNKQLFYVVLNENWRSYQVRRHVLGESANDAQVVYEESDSGFSVNVDQSSSREYIIISTGDQITTEEYLIACAKPTSAPSLVVARRENHEYEVDHQGDRFVIRSNDEHKNFRLATASIAEVGDEKNWSTLIEGSDTRYLCGFQCFHNVIALAERVDGVDQICLIERDGEGNYIEFPEPVYSVSLGPNPQYLTDHIRLGYSSMVTPGTVYDFDFDSRTLMTRKVQEVPSGYDPSLYTTYRINVPARDGVNVPVSVMHRKDTPVDGSAPLYLYGYGAYGIAIPASFSTSRLSLVERGFIFAIAHIRGGSELGHDWYEQGKLALRTNTFNDFVDVAHFLIDNSYTTPKCLAIAGGSAGGELMGAVVNQAPELWGAVAAHVPFVDVLNTMLDESLPLTPGEWPEWGNPIEDKSVFDHIRSYSPYDQLIKRSYPPMLVTAGLNDPRVTYWEPAKFVAKLRTLKTDDNLLLFKTNMGAGHGGKSGRYDSLYEVAEEYAFMLMVLGLLAD